MPVPLHRIAEFLGVKVATVLAVAKELAISQTQLDNGAVDFVTCEFLIAQWGRSDADVKKFIACANMKPQGPKLGKHWKRTAATAYRRATPHERIEYAAFALRINNHASDPVPLPAPLAYLKSLPTKRRLPKRRSPSPSANAIRKIAKDLELQAEMAARSGHYEAAGYDLHMAELKRAEARGLKDAPSDTRSYKRRIKFFASIDAWSNDTARKFCQEFGELGDVERAVLERAKSDAQAAEAIASKISIYFDHLYHLATMGRPGAARAIIEIAKDCTKKLNMITETNADALIPEARMRTVWPVTWSRLPKLRDKVVPLTKKVELAEGWPTRIDEKCQFDPNEPFHDYAAQLFDYITKLREAARKAPELVDGISIVSEAVALKPFSKKSSPHWWPLAKKIFFSTIDVTAHPDLDKLITAPSHRKKPSKIKAKFDELLQKAFKQLAPPLPRTQPRGTITGTLPSAIFAACRKPLL